MTKRNLFLGLFVLIVISLGVLVFIKLGNHSDASKTAYLTVVASPADSSVSLNGKSGTVGLNHVAPGTYKVTVSHDGFASASKSVVAQNNQDVSVAIALAPNSTKTANWYDTHPQDAVIASNITNPKYSSPPANPKASSSLSDLLPFQAYGDNPFVIAQDPDSDDPNNPVVYVEADTQAAQDDALTWLKNQGYDPSKLNLKYTTTTDSSRP